MFYHTNMKHRQINWEDARYLLSIARVGQLGKAAESLGVSVMTLSRHLNQLQTRLGSTLLERHSKGMQLTNEGSRLVEYLERAEAEIEAASSIFEQTGRSVSGTVRIAAPEGFALKVLTPRLDTLASAHPDLKLEIVSQTPGFSLSRREADVAVMVGKPSEPQLHFESLGTYRLGLYASRDYAARNRLPGCIDELPAHRLIGYVEDLMPSERLNVARTVWGGWQSNIAISSPVGQVEAVKAGLGIGVLHDFLLNNKDGLLPVFPDLCLSREFFLVSHPTMDRIPRIHTVLDFMRSLRDSVR
ncbi:MAG: LysR family transcriptional regulator [Gammaproteobacteria bacterium]|nr:LysR family transcriptional regulator [Gammaproteobacteria bacterium]